MRAAIGVVGSDIRKSEWLATLNEPTRAVKIAVWQPAIDAGDIIFSDKDLIGGMSGGPIFDASGALLGLNTATGSTATEFRNDSAFGLSVKKVFQDLRAVGLDPSVYFSCPKPPPSGRDI